MQLKSIKLNNIRSYIDEKVNFSNGSVMLSGDIGCGKSTILLAAEFALFGIMKGDVSGEGLLRNGKNEGNVELCVEIGGKEVVINRVLKRTKTGVKQDAGYLIVDGVKKTATATELKALILELLKYPKELLTKSKGLIYRYTVYTPQEEMKKILFDDTESRLNTLRKVFDVDKYKRIRENAKMYVLDLKGKIKEIEGIVTDLEEKKKNYEVLMNEIGIVEKELNEVNPILESAKNEVEIKRKSAKECEIEIQKLAKLKQELVGLETNLKNKLEQRQRNALEIERMGKQAELLREEVKGKNAEDVSETIMQKEVKLKGFESKKLEVSKKIAELDSRKKHSTEIKEKIESMDNCPLCLQNVSHDHKKAINEKEDDEIGKLETYYDAYLAQEKEADKELERVRLELDELRKKQSEMAAVNVKITNLKHIETDILVINAEQADIKKEIGDINMRKIEVSKEIEGLAGIEEKYNSVKVLLDEADKKFMDVSIKHNTLETKKKEKTVFVESVKKDIEIKEAAKLNLKGMKDTQQWLDNNFVGLMGLMEKQVMAKVYHSFNELFQNWFNMLMEDETITARLDDSFTPVIQQNGFETNMAYLSGGEKTSCALAYRLALNKVINDLITTIQTKDLIILDEPTDGFSTEQLDRVREVIEQLNMKQVIIVSHEQKVEGFVDDVVRIQKNEHISSVAI